MLWHLLTPYPPCQYWGTDSPPAAGHGGADKFHLGPFLEGRERDLAQRPCPSPLQFWTTLKDHSRQSLRCLPRSQQLLPSGNCQHSSPRMCFRSHVYHELGPGWVIPWSFLFLECHCLLSVLKTSSGSRKGWSTNVVSPAAYFCLSHNVLWASLTPIRHGLAKILCLRYTTSAMCELEGWAKVHSGRAHCMYLPCYTRTSVIIPSDFTYKTQVKKLQWWRLRSIKPSMRLSWAWDSEQVSRPWSLPVWETGRELWCFPDPSSKSSHQRGNTHASPSATWDTCSMGLIQGRMS